MKKMIRISTALIFSLCSLFLISPGACDFHPGYTVEPVMPGMDVGTPAETLPVDFWDLPLEIMLISLILPLSSIIGFPVELILMMKLYTYLGYRKICRATLLHNESRNKILFSIQENPGISYNDLVKATKINRGTLRYHLKILGMMQKIVTYSVSGYNRYYVNSGTYSELEKTVLKYLRNETDNRILWFLTETPGLTRYHLVQQFGLSPSTISWRMKRLSDEKIVRIQKTGKHVCYLITPECRQILRKYLMPPASLLHPIPEGQVSENG